MLLVYKENFYLYSKSISYKYMYKYSISMHAQRFSNSIAMQDTFFKTLSGLVGNESKEGSRVYLLPDLKVQGNFGLIPEARC